MKITESILAHFLLFFFWSNNPVCELRNKLEDLKELPELQEHLKVDTLVRFIRLSKHNVNDAEKEIRGYYQWRKEYGVDDRMKKWEGSEAQRLWVFLRYCVDGVD